MNAEQTAQRESREEKGAFDKGSLTRQVGLGRLVSKWYSFSWLAVEKNTTVYFPQLPS